MRYLYSQESTVRGVNNRDFAKNIKTRITHVKHLIMEDAISEGNGFVIPIAQEANSLLHINMMIIFLFFLSALIFNLLFLKASTLAWNNTLGTYVIYGMMFLFSFFSPSSMRGFHMSSLLPFPQLIVSIFIENLGSIIKRSRLSILWKSSLVIFISGIILAPILIIDICLNYGYQINLARTGGSKSFWSPVIYKILEYIKVNNIAKYPVYCSDWGWDNTLPFITDDGFDFKYDLDQYHYASKSTLYDNLKRILEKEPVIYFIVEHESRHFDLLQDYMVDLSRNIILETSFYNKAKEPLFHLYRVEKFT